MFPLSGFFPYHGDTESSGVRVILQMLWNEWTLIFGQCKGCISLIINQALYVFRVNVIDLARTFLSSRHVYTRMYHTLGCIIHSDITVLKSLARYRVVHMYSEHAIPDTSRFGVSLPRIMCLRCASLPAWLVRKSGFLQAWLRGDTARNGILNVLVTDILPDLISIAEDNFTLQGPLITSFW